jgi:hypothetical protein
MFYESLVLENMHLGQKETAERFAEKAGLPLIVTAISP